MLLATISLLLLISAELAYFKMADHFNIIDKPNNRSSHTQPIIRGGGIIFFFGVVIWFVANDFQWPWFGLSILIIAVISFLDDATSLNAGVRFVFQCLAILLLFYQLWPLDWPPYLLVAAVVVCIGTLNAFNFMDGINGITGVYALVIMSSFAAINFWISPFTDARLLLIVSISIFVFLYFNFRKQARCFAGDVGSVTIALILIFILLQLIKTTHNFLWPLLFLVYGTDSVVTIVYRLKRKENIFEAHRTHLFQYLSNELRIPHLMVSAGYGLIQAFINFIITICFWNDNMIIPIVLSLVYVFFFIVIRGRVVKVISRVS